MDIQRRISQFGKGEYLNLEPAEAVKNNGGPERAAVFFRSGNPNRDFKSR